VDSKTDSDKLLRLKMMMKDLKGKRRRRMDGS